MLRQSRDWIRIVMNSFSSRQRSSDRSSRPGSAPRLEPLEDRMLLIAGELDPTFAMGGKIITDFIGHLDSYAFAVAVQSDKKLVVAGTAGNSFQGHFAIARFTVDGKLDLSFGTGGTALTDFTQGTVGSNEDVARSVAIQADGKIIAVGGPGRDGRRGMELVRYQVDGTLDMAFGTAGKVITTFSDLDTASSVAIQPDGKIVVAGFSEAGSEPAELARYNVDGSLDATFGTGGEVTAPFGGTFLLATSVVVQPDGRIVVGGQSASHALGLARFNPNGSADLGFGMAGLVTTPSGSTDGASALPLQADGKILLTGSRNLVRYNPDGSLDPSFGTGGIVTTPAEIRSVHGAAIQEDGKIVVVAKNTFASFQNQAFAVARYNFDGSLDTTFASGGIAMTSFGGGVRDGRGVALVPGGGIVAAGSAATSVANASGFALVRYNSDGSLDTMFGGSGKVLAYAIGRANTSANALALQPDGMIVIVGNEFDVARYTPDARLDPSFGAGGKLIAPTGVPGDAANGIALQRDGKIVVVGRVADRFALMRFNPNGSLDSSFGVGGMVTTDFGFSSSEADAIVIALDGKIIVAGTIGSSAFALARYNADGSLDTSFGTGGKVTTDVSVWRLDQVALQGDGKIVVAGSTITTQGHTSYAISTLARYNTDGRLDPTFGSGGKVQVGASFPSPLRRGLALQADGKVLVTFAQFVSRLNTDGSADTSFGLQGSLNTDVDPEGIAVQADGKIIVVGPIGFNNISPAPGNFALARYNADGTRDATFGTGGMISTDFAGNPVVATSVLLQSDGKIVAAGGAQVDKGGDFAVARYLADNVGSPNERFVKQVYWDLLRRPVEPSGLAFWSGLLDQGLSRTQIVTAIQSSLEYHVLVVGDLYKLVLGRLLDSSGLATWVSFLNQGHAAEQLEAILLGSAEFFVTHGSDNSQGFLPALYQIVFQRPIDPTGAQAWGQALQSGTFSRQAVAAAVLAGVESDRLETQSLYMQFLHRAADPGGLNTFSTALQRGVSKEQVAIVLLSSPEYFARV